MCTQDLTVLFAGEFLEELLLGADVLSQACPEAAPGLGGLEGAG